MNPDDVKMINFKNNVKHANDYALLNSLEIYVAIPRAVRSRIEEEGIAILRKEILDRMEKK